MKITGFLVGDRQLVARIGALPDRVRLRVDATVKALGHELEARVKSAYLRGPRPAHLGVVTGRLLSSITPGGADSRSRFESTASGAFYYVGTNVGYGAAWEHGFDRRIGAGARGGPRTLTGSAYERYFAKHPPGTKHEGARPFLQPALNDLRARIVEKLTQALKDGAAEALRP